MNVPAVLFRVTGTILVGGLTYEAAALTTGRYPSVTRLCQRHRWLEATVAAVFLIHLHVLKEIVDQVSEDLTSVQEACADAADPDAG